MTVHKENRLTYVSDTEDEFDYVKAQVQEHRKGSWSVTHDAENLETVIIKTEEVEVET